MHSVLFALGCLLATISSSCVVVAAQVELLSVTGCERPPPEFPQRGVTLRCFADDATRPVTLSIRGRGFPADGPLFVRLRPHAPLPSANDTPTGGHPAETETECVGVRRSRVFPRQLLSCALPPPPPALLGAPRWMDLRLDAAHATLAVRRRAVQLSAGASPQSDNSNDNDKDDEDDPLEVLGEGAGGWTALGVGGLREPLRALHRRVLLGRRRRVRGVVSALRLPHVRGVLLHGPPGNGKTLIAQTLARLLSRGAAQVMLVNAVDILSKYVGESERNLRDLFAADGEWDAPHPATDGGPPLRVIVLDEMDALFRRRGGVGDADHDAGGARALYDGVTNQLLTLMDGTAAVREVLVIGLTNRLHAIDRALLRPGRFEVVIEIPAPDVAGREEMFAIHTRQLRATGCLDANVSLAELAQRSAGFSGADVAGAVRAATSYALQRHYEELQRHTGASSMDGKRTTMPDEAEGGADAPSSNAEDDFDEVVITGDTVMRTTRSRPGVAGRDGASDGSGAELAFRVTAHDFALALRDVAPRAVSDTPFAPIDYDGGVSRAVGVVRRLWSALHSGRGSRAAVVLLRGSPGAGKSCVARWLLVAVGCAERRVLRGSEDVDEALSAVRAAGDGCAVVDDADRLERDGRRRLREALRGLREGGGGRWLVVLTSTERLAWGGAEVDARLLLRPVEGAGLDAMLRHDRIVRNDTEPISALRRAFPAGIAFRVYRRLLDLALWRAKEEATGERAERFAKVAMGSSDATPLSEKEQTELATSIGSVASEMGLVDPSDGLVEMDYVIEGEEIDW